MDEEEIDSLTLNVNDSISAKFAGSKLIKTLYEDKDIDNLTASAADEYMDEIVISEIAKVSNFRIAQNAVKNIRIAFSVINSTTSPEDIRNIMLTEIKNAIMLAKQ